MTTEELRACKIGGCCGKDTPLLPADTVRDRLGALPDWSLSADGKLITREFVAKNWGAAMAFFNSLSEIAEEEGHHPDIHLTGWRNVRVELTTHAIGGLSMPDLVLAAKIDAIEVDYSPKWLRERGAAKPEAGANA
jgi:4a-hydroxytetrahydrobiopterin dehydratase